MMLASVAACPGVRVEEPSAGQMPELSQPYHPSRDRGKVKAPPVATKTNGPDLGERRAKLLFSSGFEGMEISPPANAGRRQYLLGTDTVTGQAWSPNFWGSDAYLQLLTGVWVDNSTVSNYISNRIERVVGHDGSMTNALYQALNQRGTGVTQDALLISPTNSLSQQSDLYTSQWVKFQPNLSSQLVPGQMPSGDWGNWRTLWEFKTGGQGAYRGGDYRIQLVVYQDPGGELYWSADGSNNANGPYPYQKYWQVENHNVAVPTDQWFKLETFTHRSTGSDGEFWVKINGQTIVDHRGPNIGVRNDPINRLILSNVYTGGNLPAYQLVDDVQVWDGVPSGTAPTLSP
jgi:hypothetical protein